MEVISDMSGGGGGEVKYHGVVANGYHNGTDAVDGEEDVSIKNMYSVKPLQRRVL